jgi:cysteine desulfurase / selenocysteine lyase
VEILIYLDNAATSWPKPEPVYITMDKVLREYGGNAGRGSHKLSLAAGEFIYEARMLCAKLFHAPTAETICFTANTTEALNLALKGTLRSGDHVITGSMEHNSITRPLKKLENSNIRTTKVMTSPETGIDLTALNNAFEKDTKLVVCGHVSNVTGTINPVREIGRICRDRGVLFLVDAAQSAGMEKIDVTEMNIDLLAFPGHKGLLGPQGTGGLYIRDGITLETLKEGGTGTSSESLDQPSSGPERYESGTMNNPGIAAMAAGIRFLLGEGEDKISARESQLINQLISGLEKIDGVRLYGPKAGSPRGSLVSIAIDNMDPAEAAIVLDNVFNIAVRAGLQCARDAHETLGTLGSGGVLRISPNYFNTEQEIDACIGAIKAISQGGAL